MVAQPTMVQAKAVRNAEARQVCHIARALLECSKMEAITNVFGGSNTSGLGVFDGL